MDAEEKPGKISGMRFFDIIQKAA